MQTAALAAYVQSRNLRFAGAPVTLGKILKMWQLSHDGVSATIDGAVLEEVARYCKMTVDDLTAAVEAMAPPRPIPRPVPSPLPLPSPPPAPVPTSFATVTIPPATQSEPVSEPILSAALGPAVVVGYAKAIDDDDEVEISFDEVEATPIPEGAEAASAATTMPDGPAAKSKKKRKKKS